MVREILTHIVLTVVTLLPIANPFSTAPLFLSLTARLSEEERTSQARRAAMYMAAILVVFFLAGTLIMKFFGISLPGIRIAGGLIIAVVGFRALFGTTNTDDQSATKPQNLDVAFTPIAMPSLSGPGSISVVITMSSQAKHWSSYPFIILGILVVCVVAYLVLKGSTRLYRWLGDNGILALGKIMGFILICIGMQFLLNGIFEAIAEHAAPGAGQ